MYDFDEIFERKSDKCRKWDHAFVQTKFGEVPTDFIPMWIADMDFRTPPEITNEFKRVVEHGTFGYTYAYDEFYDAVIHWQQTRHKVAVEKEWITLSYGTVSTIHYLLQAFCQVDDYIIMNTPVYDPFALAAERNHIQVICNALVVKDNRYEIDFDVLEEQMIHYRPKVYLFCSPHNPSGRIWTLAEMEKVAALCQKHRVLMVVDEVHAEHILYGKHHSALKMADQYQSNLIVLTSPNKGFNLGGLKTSYSMIPDEGIRNLFRKRLEKNSITSPNLFGIVGLIAAYEHGAPWLDTSVDYLRGNYEYLKAFITQHLPDWQLMEMESSYLAWIDISKTGFTATELVLRLAQKAGVVVEDGTHYVANGEHYLRINLGMQRSLIEEGMRRVVEEL